LRYQGTTDLVRDLMAEGVVTKTGKPFSKQAIYKVIHNCLYIGEMPHKGKRFPGQREPILDKALWAAVQAFIDTDERERRVATMTRNSPPALLKGLLYAPNGQRMVPSVVTKRAAGGKRYRYYVDNKNNRFGKGADTFGTLAADQIEALLVEQVLGVLQSPATVQSVWDAVRSSGAQLDEPSVVLAMRNLAQVWNTLFPQEQSRIVNLLIERVQLTHESVEIEWRASGWASLASEFAPNSIGAEMAEMEEV
jgi:hypothetical protein